MLSTVGQFQQVWCRRIPALAKSGVGESWSETASVISMEPDLCHYNQSDAHSLFLYNTYDYDLVREHTNLINPAMVKSSLYIH